jgi:hypothetical protein
MPLAPAGLNTVTFTKGGSAVEKAIMTAMSERNSGLGERLTALGFAGSNHGFKNSFINIHFNNSH